MEVTLELRDIDIELPGQSEKCEVIHRHRRLHLATCAAELRRPHGSARPAGGGGLPRHDQARFGFWTRHKTSSPRTLNLVFARSLARAEQVAPWCSIDLG